MNVDVMNVVRRTSPFEPAWRGASRTLRRQYGVPVPDSCGNAEEERARLDTLAIADVSGVPRAVIKGLGAGEWLAGPGWSAPAAFYQPIFDGAWSFAARTGQSEYFVEGWSFAETSSTRGVSRVIVYPREDASLLLCGAHLDRLISEAVSIPIDLTAPRLHLTDILGVSAMVLPRSGRGAPRAQIWVDPTYALYAADALSAIAKELGGGWVGADALEESRDFPEKID
jgi:hypothetical protein